MAEEAWQGEAWQRRHGRGGMAGGGMAEEAWQGEAWRRRHGRGGMAEEAWQRRHSGGGMVEEAWWRSISMFLKAGREDMHDRADMHCMQGGDHEHARGTGTAIERGGPYICKSKRHCN